MKILPKGIEWTLIYRILPTIAGVKSSELSPIILKIKPKFNIEVTPQILILLFDWETYFVSLRSLLLSMVH